MDKDSPRFRGNVREVEYLEDRCRIHYHLRRHPTVGDVTGTVSLDHAEIDGLPGYDNRNAEGQYLNDRHASYAFYDVEIPGTDATVVAVFHNSQAGNTDDFGDAAYPEDDLIGVYRHTGAGPLRVAFR